MGTPVPRGRPALRYPVPFIDERPDEEQGTPSREGQEVMLGPSQVKGAPAIPDEAIDGRPAPPERLQAIFLKMEAARTNQADR